MKWVETDGVSGIRVWMIGGSGVVLCYALFFGFLYVLGKHWLPGT